MRWMMDLSRVGLAVALVAATTSLAQAQNAAGSDQSEPSARIARATPSTASPRTGPHGGTLRAVDQIQTETVVRPGGIQVFLFEPAGQPIDPAGSRGVASLGVEGNPKRYRYDLFPGGDGSLRLPVNLSKLSGRTITTAFQLVGIDAASEAVVAYRDVSTVPADAAQQRAAAIARQKVCPVSGKPLGSMGDSVAVDAGGQTVYVCCAGCAGPVKADPAKYTAARPEATRSGGEQVRAGVFRVTEADAPYVAAQKKCPVMDEPLEAMGGPYRVHAAGKAIYICCPGCAKQIAKEPQKYLAKLAAQGIEPPAIGGAAAAQRSGG